MPFLSVYKVSKNWQNSWIHSSVDINREKEEKEETRSRAWIRTWKSLDRNYNWNTQRNKRQREAGEADRGLTWLNDTGLPPESKGPRQRRESPCAKDNRHGKECHQARHKAVARATDTHGLSVNSVPHWDRRGRLCCGARQTKFSWRWSFTQP